MNSHSDKGTKKKKIILEQAEVGQHDLITQSRALGRVAGELWQTLINLIPLYIFMYLLLLFLLLLLIVLFIYH